MQLADMQVVGLLAHLERHGLQGQRTASLNVNKVQFKKCYLSAVLDSVEVYIHINSPYIHT